VGAAGVMVIDSAAAAILGGSGVMMHDEMLVGWGR
tara:strand:- start:6454 stop:6558 length:105 start_codon:yes stop_codon:yes gene_type:complete